MTNKEPSLLTGFETEAQELLARGVTATAFSAHFFGPTGRLATLATTREERAALVASEPYRRLQDRLAELRTREAAVFEQEVEAASGRLTIAVPKSLHAALKTEAREEGVSLSELIRLKLNLPYREMTAQLLASPLRTGRAKRSEAA